MRDMRWIRLIRLYYGNIKNQIVTAKKNGRQPSQNCKRKSKRVSFKASKRRASYHWKRPSDERIVVVVWFGEQTTTGLGREQMTIAGSIRRFAVTASTSTPPRRSQLVVVDFRRQKKPKWQLRAGTRVVMSGRKCIFWVIWMSCGKWQWDHIDGASYQWSMQH